MPSVMGVGFFIFFEYVFQATVRPRAILTVNSINRIDLVLKNEIESISGYNWDSVSISNRQENTLLVGKLNEVEVV